MSFSAADYTAMLKKLLPRGVLWEVWPGTKLHGLLRGFAAELARLEGDAERALRELDPPSTLEALADWEQELGLPDECVRSSSIAERRAAVVRKLQRGTLMNEAYYESLARGMGYESAKVSSVTTFRAGVSRAGDRVWGESFKHVFFVAVPPSGEVRVFRAGASRVGERLRDWGEDALACVLEREKPAHTRVFVIYEGEE